MLTNARVITFSSALILPLALLACSGWTPFLNSNLQQSGLYIAYLLSGTVGLPGLIATTALLLLITYMKLRLGRREWLLLLGALAALLFADWCIKSLIKHLTQEPRPYLVWLSAQQLLPALDQFYRQSCELRAEQVHAASQLLALPAWLANHWQHGVNYAFPSGHTIVTITLAQFFGLIWLARAPRGAWLLPLWALAVGISRLMLGMHWVADLLASAILGSLTALLAVRWWLHHSQP
ncbi:phosphatase PAP2 family protein [Aeromonas simiae]|uniref:undecaprenyl-diphosphate phosphatase n=1 Tax=Aeromonas simiae TaxID=218936 RepID=A0A5J6WY14_9GAMM|nr:phosphatase PAP2 family protein [Aeromonas simiae]QFI54603.1 phosphatase PAP2 family protein [Aeromonas simiae]